MYLEKAKMTNNLRWRKYFIIKDSELLPKKRGKTNNTENPSASAF